MDDDEGSRDEPQNVAALKAANVIRIRRSVVKQEIRAGRVTLGQILTSEPIEPALHRWKIGDALVQVPGVGAVKRTTLLRQEGINAGLRLGDMTERQRAALAERLASHSSKRTHKRRVTD